MTVIFTKINNSVDNIFSDAIPEPTWDTTIEISDADYLTYLQLQRGDINNGFKKQFNIEVVKPNSKQSESMQDSINHVASMEQPYTNINKDEVNYTEASKQQIDLARLQEINSSTEEVSLIYDTLVEKYNEQTALVLTPLVVQNI